MSGPRGKVFRYREYAVDAERGVLTCRYELDGREFTERVTLLPGEQWRTEQDRGAPGHRLRNDRADRGRRSPPPRVLPPGPGRVRLPQSPRPHPTADRSPPRPGPTAGTAGAVVAKAGSRAVRRRDRLDRDGGADPAAGRRGAVRGEQARRPVRRDRAAGRGDRATGRPRRTRDRPAAAAFGRTRLPQRAR